MKGNEKFTQVARIGNFFNFHHHRPSRLYKMLDFEMKNKVKSTADLFVHTATANMLRGLSNEDTLYTALRPLFIVGRIIGLVPFQGVLRGANCSENIKLRWKSGAGAYAIFTFSALTFCFIINTLVSMKGTSLTPSDLAWSASLSVFYGIACFTYYYMFTRADRFLKLFRRWRELFIYYDGIDRHLGRDTKLLTIVTLTSCILEHSYAHLKFFPIVTNSEKRLLSRPQLVARLQNASAWETYYWRSHPFVGDIIPYHFTSAMFVFFCAKYAILAWNFGDVLTAVISRVIYYRFKMLHDEASRELLGKSGFTSRDTEKWRQVARDHENLGDFVVHLDSVLAPLVFVQFGVNIYYFCLQLNLGLTPSANTTLIASVYAVWSFLHLIGRILMVAISAAQVNVYAHKITHLLKKCPMECFTPEMERAERNIRTSNIGLTGLGCFTITRTFILQIVNVVFTFEIVLLQTAGPPSNCTAG